MTSRARSTVIRRPPREAAGAAPHLQGSPEEACLGLSGASNGGEAVLEGSSGSTVGGLREAAGGKAESVVQFAGGGTIVTLAQTASPPLGQGVRRQYTRPERHGARGGVGESRAGGPGGRGGSWAAERRGHATGGASYSRAVASEGEAAVTVTVSDSSSVDSPLLSPRRPLLDPGHPSHDPRVVQVELVEARRMELDSGGRFDRRATIIDR